jgi:hypothetical protein
MVERCSSGSNWWQLAKDCAVRGDENGRSREHEIMQLLVDEADKLEAIDRLCAALADVCVDDAVDRAAALAVVLSVQALSLVARPVWVAAGVEHDDAFSFHLIHGARKMLEPKVNPFCFGIPEHLRIASVDHDLSGADGVRRPLQSHVVVSLKIGCHEDFGYIEGCEVKSRIAVDQPRLDVDGIFAKL